MPKQNSSEKPMDSKITFSEEWKSTPASSRARRGLVSEESDDFKQKTLKGPNSPHYKEIKTKNIYNQTDSWQGPNNKLSKNETVGSRRTQTRRMNTNEQDTSITIWKILNAT